MLPRDGGRIETAAGLDDDTAAFEKVKGLVEEEGAETDIRG